MGRLARRLHFDAATGSVSDEDRRYLLLRADVMMGMFRNLPLDLRAGALNALRASVHEFGGRSVAAYLQQLNGDRVALLPALQEAAADLGWGAWTLRLEDDGDAQRLALEVANSPFASAYGDADAPVCAPIGGMLEAIAEVVLGAASHVQEVRCAACAAGRCCRFEARRVSAAARGMP
jgi:predicted hydrocarbon binding protein